jgi:hypothetical protein
VTGRLAYQWDVTSYVPTRAERSSLLKGLRKTRPFLEDKARLVRVKDECVRLFDDGRLSEDFYALILFLESSIEHG